MKNKGVMFGVIFGVIAVVSLVIVLVLFNNSAQDQKDKKDSSLENLHYPERVEVNDDTDYVMTEDGLLIEYSFSNYAWGNTYYGKVILNSGDIYLFDCGEDGEKASNDCLVKKVGTVEEADLFTLKSKGDVLQKETSTKNVAQDFGELLIAYKNGNQNLVLDGKGDNRIVNDTKDAKEVLTILKKYDIYI